VACFYLCHHQSPSVELFLKFTRLLITADWSTNLSWRPRRLSSSLWLCRRLCQVLPIYVCVGIFVSSLSHQSSSRQLHRRFPLRTSFQFQVVGFLHRLSCDSVLASLVGPTRRDISLDGVVPGLILNHHSSRSPYPSSRYMCLTVLVQSFVCECSSRVMLHVLPFGLALATLNISLSFFVWGVRASVACTVACFYLCHHQSPLVQVILKFTCLFTTSDWSPIFSWRPQWPASSAWLCRSVYQVLPISVSAEICFSTRQHQTSSRQVNRRSAASSASFFQATVKRRELQSSGSGGSRLRCLSCLFPSDLQISAVICSPPAASGGQRPLCATMSTTSTPSNRLDMSGRQSDLDVTRVPCRCPRRVAGCFSGVPGPSRGERTAATARSHMLYIRALVLGRFAILDTSTYWTSDLRSPPPLLRSRRTRCPGHRLGAVISTSHHSWKELFPLLRTVGEITLLTWVLYWTCSARHCSTASAGWPGRLCDAKTHLPQLSLCVLSGPPAWRSLCTASLACTRIAHTLCASSVYCRFRFFRPAFALKTRLLLRFQRRLDGKHHGSMVYAFTPPPARDLLAFEKPPVPGRPPIFFIFLACKARRSADTAPLLRFSSGFLGKLSRGVLNATRASALPHLSPFLKAPKISTVSAAVGLQRKPSNRVPRRGPASTAHAETHHCRAPHTAHIGPTHLSRLQRLGVWYSGTLWLTCSSLVCLTWEKCVSLCLFLRALIVLLSGQDQQLHRSGAVSTNHPTPRQLSPSLQKAVGNTGGPGHVQLSQVVSFCFSLRLLLRWQRAMAQTTHGSGPVSARHRLHLSPSAHWAASSLRSPHGGHARPCGKMWYDLTCDLASLCGVDCGGVPQLNHSAAHRRPSAVHGDGRRRSPTPSSHAVARRRPLVARSEVPTVHTATPTDRNVGDPSATHATRPPPTLVPVVRAQAARIASLLRRPSLNDWDFKLSHFTDFTEPFIGVPCGTCRLRLLQSSDRELLVRCILPHCAHVTCGSGVSVCLQAGRDSWTARPGSTKSTPTIRAPMSGGGGFRCLSLARDPTSGDIYKAPMALCSPVVCGGVQAHGVRLPPPPTRVVSGSMQSVAVLPAASSPTSAGRAALRPTVTPDSGWPVPVRSDAAVPTAPSRASLVHCASPRPSRPAPPPSDVVRLCLLTVLIFVFCIPFVAAATAPCLFTRELRGSRPCHVSMARRPSVSCSVLCSLCPVGSVCPMTTPNLFILLCCYSCRLCCEVFHGFSVSFAADIVFFEPVWLAHAC